MPLPEDRKKVIRIAGLAVSVLGLAVAAAALLNFVRSVAHNAIEGGPALARFPEYYRQVGAYYARGFTTGFFACYFLMMLAVIVGVILVIGRMFKPQISQVFGTVMGMVRDATQQVGGAQ